MRLQAWVFRILGYKTIKEMTAEMNAGRRRMVNRKEMDRAKRLSLALLPPGIHFPKAGELWEAMHDTEVSYLVAYAAPYTGGGKAMLPAGERVIADASIDEQPVGAYFSPVRYKELEAVLVPREDRDTPKYDGYYLFIDTLELNKSFRLVEQADHEPAFRERHT